MSNSGLIRCRSVKNCLHEVTLVVNSPRSDLNYIDYNWPTLFFPIVGIRRVFTVADFGVEPLKTASTKYYFIKEIEVEYIKKDLTISVLEIFDHLQDLGGS